MQTPMTKRVNFKRLNTDYTSNKADYDDFRDEMRNHGLEGWSRSAECPYS